MPYTRVDSKTDDIEVSRSETSPNLAVAMDKGGRQSSRWKERGLSFKWSRSRPDSSLLNTILLAPGEEEVETSAKRWSSLDEDANGVTRMSSRESPEQYKEKSVQKRRPSRLSINSGNNGSNRDAMGKRGRRDGSEKDRLSRPARLGAESTKKKTEKPSTEERAYTAKKTTKKPGSTAEKAPSTTKGETTSPQAGQPAIKATRQRVFDTESVPDPSKQPPKRMLTPLIQKDGQTVPLKTVQKTGKALPQKPSEQPTPKRRGVKKMLGGLFSRKKKKKEAAPPVETTRDTALAPLRDGKSVKEILKDLDNMSMMSPSEAGTRWSDSQSSDKMSAKARKYEKKALGLLSKLISDEKLARRDPHTDLAERDMIEKDPEKVVAMAKKAYEYAAEAKRLHEVVRNTRKSRSAPFTFDQYSIGLDSFNSSSELSLSTTSNLSFQRSLSRSVRSRSSNPAQNRTAATDSSMKEKTNEEDSNVLKMSSNDIFRTISQKCLPCSSGEDQLGAFYASEARNILISVSNEKDEEEGSIESSVIDMINGLVAATTEEPFPEPPPKSRISVVTTDAQEKKKKERSTESPDPEVDETEPVEKENVVENSEDTTSEDKNDDLSAMVAEPNIVCYPIVAGLEAFRSCQNPNESQNERDATVCKKASDVSSSWGSSAAPRSVDVTEASSGSYGSENNSRTTTGSGGVKSRGADSEPRHPEDKLEHDDIDDWSAHSNRGSLGSEESYSDSDSEYSTGSGILGWIQSFHD